MQGEVGEPGQKGSKADKGEQVCYWVTMPNIHDYSFLLNHQVIQEHDLMGCSSNTFLCLYPGSSWSIWSPRSDRRPWSCCKYKSPSKDSDNFALLGKQLRGSNPFGKMTCLSKQMLRKVNFLLVLFRELRVRCGV